MEDKIRKKKIIRITLWGSIGNALLLIFKFIAGFIGNSGAMLADAVHSLSDFLTDLIVMIFVSISAKPKDDGHNYGHGKFETLATAIIGLVLLGVGFGLMWQGGARIFGYYFRNQVLEAPGTIALVAAFISILIKELLFRITRRAGEEYNSQALLANGWHHRSDAFSSIGTALGIGGAILLGENWRVLDPIAAVIVSFLIVKVAIQLVIPALNDLLEISLPDEIEQEIEALILETPEVVNPHNLKTRRIGNMYAIEAHIRVDGSMSVHHAHELTLEIEQRLREHFGKATHISLHVEPIKEE